MDRILIADTLEESGLAILRASGAEVRVLEAEDKPALAEILPEYDALVVRSATKVTRALLAAPGRLRVIGRAGIGVDNVDVPAATERGILVVNAPTGNVLSATEHTFALLLALVRKVPAADASMKRGEWDRKSFLGTELAGKTLGVVGYGKIGQKVAARAQAFEMQVVTFDPYLDPAVARRQGVEPVAIDELVARADVVSFHTPLTGETRNLLSAERIARLRRGALVVNCGRGGVLDEAALLAALAGGQLGGAALDVFEEEPTPRLDLVRHPRVVATPHVGAQTAEAQERIAVETAKMVLGALQGSLAVAAVNLPFTSAGRREEPYLRLGDLLGRLAGGLVEGGLRRVEIATRGLAPELAAPAAVAAVRGVLARAADEEVNLVNAEHLAAARGLEVEKSVVAEPGDYPELVTVRLVGEKESIEVAGALFGGADPRVVGFGGYRLEFQPEGNLLFLENRDVPGVVGQIGTLLGDAGVNIGDIHLARREATREALAVLRLDSALPPAVLDRLRALPTIFRARALSLH
jgi:D-3-phosphoglycerate dehydrogenase